MKKSKEILKLETKEEVKKFLQEPTLKIAEFLTGILSHSEILPTSYVLSAGKIVQATIKGKMLTQFGKEIEKYIEEGKIKEDYFATNKNQVSLLELLKFVDADTPDEEVFNAMKSIFFSSVKKDSSTQQEEVGYQLLLLCKKLSSIDLLILKACYEIYIGKHTDVNTGINDFEGWVVSVSIIIGYDLPDLIKSRDDKLIEYGLLTPRTYADRSGIRPSKEFRLTPMSIKLFQYISEWNK